LYFLFLLHVNKECEMLISLDVLAHVQSVI